MKKYLLILLLILNINVFARTNDLLKVVSDSTKTLNNTGDVIYGDTGTITLNSNSIIFNNYKGTGLLLTLEDTDTNLVIQFNGTNEIYADANNNAGITISETGNESKVENIVMACMNSDASLKISGFKYGLYITSMNSTVTMSSLNLSLDITEKGIYTENNKGSLKIFGGNYDNNDSTSYNASLLYTAFSLDVENATFNYKGTLLYDLNINNYYTDFLFKGCTFKGDIQGNRLFHINYVYKTPVFQDCNFEVSNVEYLIMYLVTCENNLLEVKDCDMVITNSFASIYAPLTGSNANIIGCDIKFTSQNIKNQSNAIQITSGKIENSDITVNFTQRNLSNYVYAFYGDELSFINSNINVYIKSIYQSGMYITRIPYFESCKINIESNGNYANTYGIILNPGSNDTKFITTNDTNRNTFTFKNLYMAINIIANLNTKYSNITINNTDILVTNEVYNINNSGILLGHNILTINNSNIEVNNYYFAINMSTGLTKHGNTPKILIDNSNIKVNKAYMCIMETQTQEVKVTNSNITLLNFDQFGLYNSGSTSSFPTKTIENSNYYIESTQNNTNAIVSGLYAYSSPTIKNSKIEIYINEENNINEHQVNALLLHGEYFKIDDSELIINSKPAGHAMMIFLYNQSTKPEQPFILLGESYLKTKSYIEINDDGTSYTAVFFKENSVVLDYDPDVLTKTLRNIEIVKHKYEVIDETKSIINEKENKGKLEEYIIRIDADDSLFEKLEIDNVELIKDIDYTVTHGSTIITFTESGLNKINDLENGEHEVKVSYTNGNIVNTTLNVEITLPDINNPKTGDNIIIYIILTIISLITIYLLRRNYETKRYN